MLEEALELRTGGIEAPILILSDSEPACAEAIITKEIRQAVYTFDMARTLSAAARRIGKRAKIHLKIDTGMGRIGFRPDSAPEEAERIAALEGRNRRDFTPFAMADEFSEDSDPVYRGAIQNIL